MHELEEIRLLQKRANFNVLDYVITKETEFFDIIDVEELTDLLKTKIGMEIIHKGIIFDFVEKFSIQQAILSARLEIEGHNRPLKKRIKR